jgi:DNA polymerase elongation subunit (family B)
MYKIEVKIDGQFINNFSNGSICDLVFLDLEFWPDYLQVQGKAVQKIYGYTITRILKTSKQQYIKINFLEFESEENQLVEEIIKDIERLKNKIFIGFNIKNSDLITLRNRSKVLAIHSNVNEIKLFDFRDYSQLYGYKGLNSLFEHLEIKVNKNIGGSYFRKNPRKVFLRKSGWIDILLNMFEYCLEDAAGYFEIVSNWNQKNPIITEGMIKTESLNYSELEKKPSVTLIHQDSEIFSMQNFQASSDQLLSSLTVADLEALIVKIVQKTFKEEMQKLKHEHLPDQVTQMNHSLKLFV